MMRCRPVACATRLVGVALVSGLLQACAVGPDFVTPKAPLPLSAQQVGPETLPQQWGEGQSGQHISTTAALPAAWWKQFGSEQLNKLVQEALSHNPQLGAARNSLQRARDVLQVESGLAFWPTADLNLGASRQRILNLPVFPKPPTVMYSTFGATVGVSYTLDLFGGQRRTVEAAAADVDRARFEYEAARLSLVANVCNTAIGSASLAKRMVLAQQAQEAAQALLDAALTRKQLGQVNDSAVLQAQGQLAAQAQVLPALRSAHHRMRTALAVLLGRTPDQAPQDVELDSLSLPPELPESLPSQLVRQRPDIQAAEARLHEATATYGAAIANLYPQITLRSDWGRNGYTYGQMLSGPPAVWNIVGGLTQPIFRAGALDAAKRAAGLDNENALAAYVGTVLLAWQNVADVRSSLVEDAQLQQAAQQAQAASAAQLRQDRQRVALGSLPAIALQADAVPALNEEAAAVAALAQRYVDTVAWYQAVSGPVPEESAKPQ